jgi:hypothetical protein
MKIISLGNSDEFAVVDDEDFEKVNQFNWTLSANGYAYRRMARPERKVVFMHRFILSFNDPSLDVDHINGKKLDNRKSNLRIATRSQNMKNSKAKSTNPSGYKGVNLRRFRWVNTWRASIEVKGKQIHIGSFKTPEEAAHAYDQAAKKYFGEFAKLNFPENQP